MLLISVAQAAGDSPPNVVLIISDDRLTDYGFMGHPEIETPNLDKLARESAVFKRGYVPIAALPSCTNDLSRGLYSHQKKTTGNDPAATPQNRAHATKAERNPGVTDFAYR